MISVGDQSIGVLIPITSRHSDGLSDSRRSRAHAATPREMVSSNVEV